MTILRVPEVAPSLRRERSRLSARRFAIADLLSTPGVRSEWGRLGQPVSIDLAVALRAIDRRIADIDRLIGAPGADNAAARDARRMTARDARRMTARRPIDMSSATGS